MIKIPARLTIGQSEVFFEDPIAFPVMVVVGVSSVGIVSFSIITSVFVVMFLGSTSSDSVPKETVKYFFMSSSLSEELL